MSLSRQDTGTGGLVEGRDIKWALTSKSSVPGRIKSVIGITKPQSQVCQSSSFRTMVKVLELYHLFRIPGTTWFTDQTF